MSPFGRACPKRFFSENFVAHLIAHFVETRWMRGPALWLIGILSPLISAWGQPSTLEWVQAFPATSPPPEFDAAATYDSKRQVMVMFGGSGIPLSAQTWEWNGASWNQRTAPGPEARVGSALAFDSARGVSVLFGGHNNNQQKVRDTWEWNGVAWQFRTTNGPVQRADHTMVYDMERKRTVLYGGFINLDTFLPAETWEWDGNTWERVGVDGPPLRRYEHAMAYDAKRKVALLFGGVASADGTNVNLPTDTWAWDGSAWRQVATTGPSGRYRPKMVYDSQREVVVLFGGEPPEDVHTELTDVWEWNGSRWSLQTATGVGGRDLPAVVYDSTRQEIVRYGGNADDVNHQFKVYDDTWILRLRQTWVDFSYLGNETGEFATPFNTLHEGSDFAPAGTILNIKAGSSPETLQLIKPVTIQAIGGPVIVGHP
jgi:hypothetical protein